MSYFPNCSVISCAECVQSNHKYFIDSSEQAFKREINFDWEFICISLLNLSGKSEVDDEGNRKELLVRSLAFH